MTNEFKTFNKFLAENTLAEVTILIDKNNPPSKSTLLEDVLAITTSLGISLLEDIGKTGDDFTAYGVKGKLKAKGEQEDGQVVNPNSEITKDDKKVLTDIDGKITRGLQLFGDLEAFLDAYGKINKKPISTIIAQLASFQEAVQGELTNMPG